MRYVFMRFKEGKTKAVTFSYDDAIRSDLTMADILKKHNMTGTFNVSSSNLNSKVNLTVSEMKELIRDGFEIACHGKAHLSAARLRPIRTISEALECRLELEKALGEIIRGYAYPDTGFLNTVNGGTLEKAEEILKDIDFAYARTTECDTRFALPTDWLFWKGTVWGVKPNVDECIEEFLSIDVNSLYPSERWPRLFYMWGHSSEFSNDWSRLEKICDRLGGKDDTWYATNIDICDYCRAYEQLIWSADGLTVKNPTVTDLWIDVDGKTVKIPSAQTVNLQE